MKVYRVNKEISIDIGKLVFTMQPNDYFEHNGSHITKVYYFTSSQYCSNEMSILNVDLYKLKLHSSIRIGNNSHWTPIENCIGREIEDITKQYLRDKRLESLGL